jgi:flagellar biosynthesis protein FlhF
MNLRTFSAATFAQAMALVKTEMGGEAVILHTRTLQRKRWLGLRRREVVEITAGVGLNVAARPVRRPAASDRRNGEAERGRAAETPMRRPGPTPARPATAAAAAAQVNPGKDFLETPAANRAMMMSISSEVRELRGVMEDLVKRAKRESAPQVPEKLFDYYTNLIQNQVADELATDMVRQLQTYRPEQLQQRDFVRDRLTEQVERMIPSSGAIERKKEVGPHVVALIGPTGVGKTTTLAKIAANLQIRERRRVGLITIDTYRIAAIDQLRKYAELIGSPLKAVNNAEDLREAVRAMSDCEFILIDTAGRSPTDTLKLNELKGFLDAANPDEVHLVLSSAASQQCIERAIERFGQVRVDKMIFTKLDEAVHVGVVLNVIRKVNKTLSYVTTGQNVPEDIEVGKGSKFAQMLLGTNP